MLWSLPVVFICENNKYAMGTSVERTSKTMEIVKLADAYDMPGDTVDGMKPEEVHKAIERAVKRAREIGRASCRESVGQYVSISVVAVALTKKTNNAKKQQ